MSQALSGSRVAGNHSEPSDLPDTFRALCRKTAADHARGDVIPLITAVDKLYAWAFTRGLVEAIGDDAVQEIMADAFRPYREG